MFVPFSHPVSQRNSGALHGHHKETRRRELKIFSYLSRSTRSITGRSISFAPVLVVLSGSAKASVFFLSLYNIAVVVVLDGTCAKGSRFREFESTQTSRSRFY